MPEEERKTLADLAHSCADAEGPRSPNHEKPHKSLAEAAMEYQEHLSPPNSQPAKVAVVTGEEEEKNVLQVSTFINFRLVKPQNALSYQSRFSPCTIITDGELRSVLRVFVFQVSFLVVVIRDLTKLRRRRQGDRQKSHRFNEQNNTFAHASRFFVHFFDVPSQLRREMTRFSVYLRTGTARR